MGRYLPSMVKPSKIRKITQSTFGGIDLTPGACDGAIRNMKNMSGEGYPVLSPRKPRHLIRTLDNPYGVYAHDGLMWVDGSSLWHMREARTTYDVFSGSGTVKKTNPAGIGVSLEASISGWNNDLFEELLKITLRSGEVQDPILHVEKTSRGSNEVTISSYGSIGFETDMGRNIVYIFSGANMMVRATRDNAKFVYAEQYGFSEKDFAMLKLNISFPKVMPVKVGSVIPGKKCFASLSSRVVMFPDKKYFDVESGEVGDLEIEWYAKAVFSDGTYAGVSAKGCSIISQNIPFSFNAGDAVTVKVEAEDGRVNNGTFIVREVSEDNMTITFYENTFETSDTEYVCRITRKVPDLDYICECGGRLWGCKGDMIFASKLGDPFNWNVFDGISTDSWQIEVQSAGDFTGCTSYLGMPVFFKEQTIYKVYGTKPSEYQLIDTATLGVDNGSGGSLAVAGEILFYTSRGNIVAYTGATPRTASNALGSEKLRLGTGGSDGVKYYISAKNANDVWTLYVYDTVRGLWHKEDSLEVIGFASEGDSFYMLSRDGGLYLISSTSKTLNGAREEVVESECEFAPFVSGTTERKGVGRITLRCSVEDFSRDQINVFICYDGHYTGEGVDNRQWEHLGLVTPERYGSFSLTFVPKRCDSFSLKIEGRGHGWKIYSITREYYVSDDYR